MITRICPMCEQRVQPQKHDCHNKGCHWWTCPLCRSDHWRTYSIDRRKRAKK